MQLPGFKAVIIARSVDLGSRPFSAFSACNSADETAVGI
jgi:hypothetical protein